MSDEYECEYAYRETVELGIKIKVRSDRPFGSAQGRQECPSHA